MSPRVRLLRHPGPVDPVRLESSVEPAGRSVRLQLEQGRSLLEAIAGPIFRSGIASATFKLVGGRVSRVRYVLARPDPASSRVVGLTDPIEAQDVSLVTGNGTLGRGGDGEPFIHCHALFGGADGGAFGGHVLPEWTLLGEGVVAYLRGFSDVSVELRHDPEIDAAIFRPRDARTASPPPRPG